MKKKDKVYYARTIPSSGIYDVCELTIRTVEADWFVGIDKSDKHAYFLKKEDIGKTVFTDRKSALEKVRSAEDKVTDNTQHETYYEEY